MESITVGLSVRYIPLGEGHGDRAMHPMPDGTHQLIISMDIDWGRHRFIPRIGEEIQFGVDFSVLIEGITHDLPTREDGVEDLYIFMDAEMRHLTRAAWTSEEIRELERRISTYPNVTLTG